MIIPTNTKKVLARRALPASYGRATTTFIERQSVNVAEAARQFREFLALVDAAGFPLERLNPLAMPDEVFLQDHGLSLGEEFLLANLTTMRRKELPPTTVYLRKLNVKLIPPPLHVNFEGGDTVTAWTETRSKKTIFVGQRSQKNPRTNRAAFDWVKEHGERLGHTVIPVPFERCLHLSTGASFIGNGRGSSKPVIVFNPDWVDPEPFIAAGFQVVPVGLGEPFAANLVRLGENGKVIIRSDAQQLDTQLRKIGFETQPHQWDQMATGEGGFTCCLNPVEG